MLRPLLLACLALVAAPLAAQSQATAPVPQVFVSFPPAVLVRVDGTALLTPVPGRAAVERVRNTRAAILLASTPNTEPVSDRNLRSAFYLRVDETWLTADFLVGPWAPADLLPFLRRRLDALHADLVQRGEVEPLTAKRGSEAAGPIRVFVSEIPAVLVLFDGPPRFEAVPGTDFVRAANADHLVLRGGPQRAYFTPVGERWLTAPALGGPWTAAPPDALPAGMVVPPR